MRYAWIKQHQAMYPVTWMCHVLKVSTSGYYDAVHRAPTRRDQRQARIRQDVQQVYQEHHGIYGNRKIAQVMVEREALKSACRNTVVQTKSLALLDGLL